MWSRPSISSAWSEISVGRNVPCFVRQVSLIVEARPSRRTRSSSSLSSGSSAGWMHEIGVSSSSVARVAEERAAGVVGGEDAVVLGVHDVRRLVRVLEDGPGDEVARGVHRRHPACETASDVRAESVEPPLQQASPGG